MNLIIQLIFFLVIAIVGNVHATDDKGSWSGTLRDGKKINHHQLREIVKNHEYLSDISKNRDANMSYHGEETKRWKEQRIVDLQAADLSNADLRGADLKHAFLGGSKLIGANLDWADLSHANLDWADLSHASLRDANLSHANLWHTNLSNAILHLAYLSDANLTKINLTNVLFELEPNRLPNIPTLSSARSSFSSLKYFDSPHSLVELREAFKKTGLYREEREITYALKYTQIRRLLGKIEDPNEPDKIIKKSIAGVIEDYLKYILNLILFEWTCEWGQSPGRPLAVLCCLIFFFFWFYMAALMLPNKKDGIWKLWIGDRVRKDLGQEEPELLYFSNAFPIIGYSLYFSLLSAFNLGWRDLNIGGWIARIQPREYRLVASGWVRVVSGIQSLISVYLLALSVLTLFGRPFESY